MATALTAMLALVYELLVDAAGIATPDHRFRPRQRYWLLVQTLFTLRYATIYYRDSDGVEFNEKEPPQIR